MKKADHASSESSFFRKGESGDWENYFSDADKVLFKEIAGDLLVEMRYAADHTWSSG